MELEHEKIFVVVCTIGFLNVLVFYVVIAASELAKTSPVILRIIRLKGNPKQ